MGTIIVENCERCGAPNPRYLDEDTNEVICEQCARLTDPGYFTAGHGAAAKGVSASPGGNTGPTTSPGLMGG